MRNFRRNICGETAGIIIGCCLLIVAGASPGRAQIQEGNSIASFRLGFGLPVSDLNLSSIGGGDQTPGDLGIAVGGQYVYQVSNHLGLGAEIGYTDLGDRDFTGPGLRGTIGSNILTMQGIARYLFTPQKTISPYILGGFGINRFSAQVHETNDPSNVLLDASSTGVAFSLGGGLQGSLNKTVIAGAELRWLLATIDSSKFGTDTVNALNFMAWLGCRF